MFGMIPEPKGLGRVRVNPSCLQVASSRLALWAPQPLGQELRGTLGRVREAGSADFVGPRWRWQSQQARRLLQCLGKGEAFAAHQKSEAIPTHATAKTVKQSFLWTHGQRGMCVRVKWTDADILLPLKLQVHEGTDELDCTLLNGLA
jgi:hypothetical protein